MFAQFAAIACLVAASTLQTKDLPLTPPADWTATKESGSVVLTPKNLKQGQFLTILATPLQVKAGTLDQVYAIAKAMIDEVGTYAPLASPPPLKSDGGWEYKFTIGWVQQGGKALLVQVVGLKKGDQGGAFLALADGEDTMQQYATAIGQMLRGLGGTAKPPETAAVGGGAGAIDLQMAPAAGWQASKGDGFVKLEAAKEDFYTNYRWTLIILPTQTLQGSLRQAFRENWNSLILSTCESNVAPLPLFAEGADGHIVAFDGDSSAKVKSNGSTPLGVNLYLIVKGNRCTPVVAVLYGFEKKLEAELEAMLTSARIPGGSGATPALFTKSELVGNWSESSASYANYVTASGAYAGDASIATGSYLDLRTDGGFSSTFIGITSSRRLKEQSSGTWSIQGDQLLLKSSAGTQRFQLFGCGNDPKAGRFLVTGNYADRPAKITLANPRGPFQARWFRAK